MLKLLKLAVLIGLVAGLVLLLPLGGRTLFERWRAAHGVSDFAARSWAELRGGAPPGPPGAARKGKSGRPAEPPGPRSAPDQPLDTTTDADRKALDKLLDQQLSEKPKR